MKKVVLLIFLSFVAVYADLKSITTAEFVRECPAAKRELPRADLERLATVLQGKHWKSGISNLINAFKQVKKSERQEVIDSLFHLRKEHIKSSTLAKLINSIVTVEPGHRKEVSQSARDLVKYCEGIPEVQNLINILAKIPAGQRVRVAEKVLERSSKEESYDSVASKLAHESSIPLAEAEETPPKASELAYESSIPLAEAEETDHYGCWYPIVQVLPVDEREDIINWVQFFLKEPSPKEIEKFVSGVLLIPKQRRSSLLASIERVIKSQRFFYVDPDFLDPDKVKGFFTNVIQLTPSHSQKEVMEAVFLKVFLDNLSQFKIKLTIDALVKAPAEEQGEVAIYCP